MNENKHIKSLAIYYFEGKITLNDEKILFEFINQSDANFQQFRQWEREWKSNYVLQPDTEEAWEAVSREIIQRELQNHQQDNSKTSTRFIRWSKYVAAVAIIALVVVTSLYIHQININGGAKHYVTVEAPLGQKSKVTLADGTVVWLNAGTQISYPEGNRSSDFIVKLSGEAFFEVAKQKNKKFIVRTSIYDVEVVGTKFNISSYPGDRFISTTLIEGKINLMHESNKTEMQPGETIAYDAQTGLITKSVNPLQNVNAWIDNSIIFDAISLDELSARLSRQFDVKIKLQSAQLGAKKFSIALRNNETVADVMTALEKILNVKVNKVGQTYYINSGTDHP